MNSIEQLGMTKRNATSNQDGAIRQNDSIPRRKKSRKISLSGDNFMNDFFEPMSIEDSNGRIHTPDHLTSEYVRFRRNSVVVKPNYRRPGEVGRPTALRRAVSMDSGTEDETALSEPQYQLSSISSEGSISLQHCFKLVSMI